MGIEANTRNTQVVLAAPNDDDPWGAENYEVVTA
jgi:hypothetical protein